MGLLEFRAEGIYCPLGDFFIDPWKRVPKAVITHAHADHSRWGMGQYIAHDHSIPVMKLRLGDDIKVLGLAYGEPIYINGVRVSLHPAGHIIGSSQVRVEYQGEVWVASGDYKLDTDGISGTFEPIRCHCFITESTFGLPIYRWQPPEVLYDSINEWWAHCAEENQTAVIAGYSLGKAQRIIQQLDPGIGPILVHSAVDSVNQALLGLDLPEDSPIRLAKPISSITDKEIIKKSIVVCPPSTLGGRWIKRLANPVTAMASGWMQLRGTRRRISVDKGFPLSDHADWYQLNDAVKATGCEKVIVTHGYQAAYARYLREHLSLDAIEAHTEFSGETLDNEVIQEPINQAD